MNLIACLISPLWTSSNVTVATMPLDRPGFAKAGSPGSATVRATYGPIFGTASLTVSSNVVEWIEIAPQNARIGKLMQQQYGAAAHLTDGTVQDVTAQVHWQSSDESRAVISNNAGSEGLAQWIAPGQVTITGTLGRLGGSAQLTLTNASIYEVGKTTGDYHISAYPQGAQMLEQGIRRRRDCDRVAGIA